MLLREWIERISYDDVRQVARVGSISHSECVYTAGWEVVA